MGRGRPWPYLSTQAPCTCSIQDHARASTTSRSCRPDSPDLPGLVWGIPDNSGTGNRTHTDLVARISALQELVTATRAQTTGLATAITQLETNIGHHVDSLQSYQHQLCEALHTDILRVSSTLQELKSMGSKPPAPLVHSIAHLADQALQFYNAHNAPARQ